MTLGERLRENVAASHPATPCLVYRGPLNATGYGYPRLVSRTQGTLLHRWIVEQFDGPLLPGEVVMHRCDNPPCFRYDHLKRATQRENLLDAMAKGRHRFVSHIGEDNGSAVLDEATVLAIRADWDAGGVTQTVLAERYHMSKSQIGNIVKRRQWRHL